jgi:hypothetical protein
MATQCYRKDLQAEGNIMDEDWLAVPAELRLLRRLDGRLDDLEQLVERERDVLGRDLVAELVHRDADGGGGRDAELAVDVAAKACGSVEGARVGAVTLADRRQGLVQPRDVTRDGVAGLLDALAAHRDSGRDFVADVEGPDVVEERGAHRKA